MNVKNYKTGVSWRLLLPLSQGVKITAVFGMLAPRRYLENTREGPEAQGEDWLFSAPG